MEEIIIIKESTLVGPARETPKGSVWNSNLDLMMARTHVPTVYFYKPNGNGCSSDFFDPKRLKEGLSQILVPFYPVAGRLGYDQSGRLEIVCNAEGVLFVEAEASAVMDPLIADYSDNSLVPRLVPTVDYSRRISSYPLLVLQVTTFKCGGVSLGVGLQHTLADGASAMYFINSWASTVRGMSPCNIEPYFDRTLLRARVPPTPSFQHVEYDPPLSMTTTRTMTTAAPNQSMVSIFKLTADQLNTLKSKPNTEQNSNSIKYSSFTILAAHLWRCMTKARGLHDDQATKLYIPIDGRLRLRPPLQPGFFGNAIFISALIVRAGDLQSEPFTTTVRRIHGLLKQFNDEYLRSALDWIEKTDDLNRLVRGPHTFQCPNLLINSWVWFPIYDADFGWGRPEFMRQANITEGKLCMLPSPTDDGSLLVITRLGKSTMNLFEKFLYEF